MRHLLLAFLVLIAGARGAVAEERINDFASHVTIEGDASVTVRETIAVTAEGNQIRRGIYRDIPTIYTDRNGIRTRIALDVLKVTRNGREESYAIEWLSNGIRIRIGDADRFLDYGQHVYGITYRATRLIGYFPDYDEFYWNVTGDGWNFVIDRASITVDLPPAARIRQSAGYTGPAGADGQDYMITSDSGARFAAQTTSPLPPGHGLTIATAWQKGIVAQPDAAQELRWWLSDNAGLFTLGATVLLAGLYYLWAWNKVGRDPPKGTIIPLFAPPPGLGPAGARYAYRGGFDDRCYAAGLVGLAVDGHLKILEEDGDFAIERQEGGKPLAAPAQQALAGSLARDRLELKQSNHVAVSAMRSALKNALTKQFEGSHFLRNLSWFAKGAAISIAGLLVSAFLLPSEISATGFIAVGWTSVWWSFIIFMAWGAVKGFLDGRGIARLGSLFRLVFLIPFMGAGVFAPSFILYDSGSPLLYAVLGTAAVLGLMNIVFYQLLWAPTQLGRKLLDAIEGFRLYMTTAEEERLKVLHPPEKTPELFQQYLPYALALDCENEWNAKFATVLAAAGVAAAAPSWYSGSHWDSANTGGFTDSLGAGLASSISSAATAPGSSSGSGGGGSSGGGGGGGGGGGW